MADLTKTFIHEMQYLPSSKSHGEFYSALAMTKTEAKTDPGMSVNPLELSLPKGGLTGSTGSPTSVLPRTPGIKDLGKTKPPAPGFYDQSTGTLNSYETSAANQEGQGQAIAGVRSSQLSMIYHPTGHINGWK